MTLGTPTAPVLGPLAPGTMDLIEMGESVTITAYHYVVISDKERSPSCFPVASRIPR